MSKVSRETASQGGDFGIVLDRSEELDDYTVDFITFRENVDHTPLLRGLPDDQCQCPHWGYVFKGQLTFHYTDRDEVYGEGDAYYAPPGHVPVHTAPGTEALQFSPTREVRPTSEAIMRNFQAMREASG
ncbi:hypothetical protein ABZZ74_15760 [Streptomyces sp. NPDC006476]|uniref:hypothetical protein n=1 Tax=Streptomyces sp. NPDC006476 TaxID=3157175 RepID=UPI0033A41C8A